MKFSTFIMSATLSLFASAVQAQPNEAERKPIFIGKQNIKPASDRLTPELLWAMGRIGNTAVSPDGKTVIYEVSYYSVQENKSHTVLYHLDVASKLSKLLTTTARNERTPVYITKDKIAYLSNETGTYQVWTMKADGTERAQASFEADGVSDFLFSPDGSQVILVKDVATTASIDAQPQDLPKTSGMVINDMMYRHWDQFVKAIPHPFLASFDGKKIVVLKDILEGEPYESPMLPFGGAEQLAWSPDGTLVAYTSRKKTGKALAISTDSDIYIYNVKTGETKNLCKPAGYVAPESDPTYSLQTQAVNKAAQDCNVGYDINPAFSPDGKRIAWQSMARDGYESDRNRLCVYDLATGQKTYVTETFDSSVDGFVWSYDSRSLFFSGVWHARTNLYRTNLKGEVRQLTNDTCDYVLQHLMPDGKKILVKKHSISQADEIYTVDISKKTADVVQLTFENKSFYDQLTFGKVEGRWVKTTDGKEELCWVIYPPHFDANKKYPALLYCQGGPQSAVSQFWSYRWNFQLMAANDYIIIAPNRRGLPGFGQEWLEAISGDYSGQCMQDYLSAIDHLSQEPYVDKDRLGAVGASFGGYSVYWLAGNHDKRFKCFIAHDGIFNTEQQYIETEELWFANWDLKAAPWHTDSHGRRAKAYETSPHLYVDRWDTPILCIHGMKDYRILNSQSESAFQAAQLRGIPSQLLLFPEENHWVTRPQNGMLWQRTFYNWLDKWLK